MAEWMDELKKLAELRDKGLITDEEFETERSQIVPKKTGSTIDDKNIKPDLKEKSGPPAPSSQEHGKRSHLSKPSVDQPPPSREMDRNRYKRLERISSQDQVLLKMARKWRRKYLIANSFFFIGFMVTIINLSEGSYLTAGIGGGILFLIQLLIRKKAKLDLKNCGFAERPIPYFAIRLRFLKIWYWSTVWGLSPLFFLDHTWPKRTWSGAGPFTGIEIFSFVDSLRDIGCPECGPQVYIPNGSDQEGHISTKCSTCDEIKISKEPLLAHHSEEERAICLNGMRTEMEYWSAIDPVYHPPKGYIPDKLF